MPYEPKPGSFSLFKNDRRENDRQPEYRGDGLLPDGTPCWISAWVKETRDGKKFFSISLQPKEQRGTAREDAFRRSERPGGGGSDGFPGDDGFGDSEIPFAHPYSIR